MSISISKINFSIPLSNLEPQVSKPQVSILMSQFRPPGNLLLTLLVSLYLPISPSIFRSCNLEPLSEDGNPESSKCASESETSRPHSASADYTKRAEARKHPSSSSSLAVGRRGRKHETPGIFPAAFKVYLLIPGYEVRPTFQVVLTVV